MKTPRALVACEYSGRVREALRKHGIDAWSCDLLESDDNSRYHITGDVLPYLNEGWDLMVAHPPCTYLTNSAEWAYTDGPYHQNVKPGTLVGAARREARAEALEFVRKLGAAPIKRIAIENPRGYLSRAYRKPEQTVQPYWFGDDASKATCLWLTNLPALKKTFEVAPRITADGKPRWANQTDSGQNRLSPSEDRWKIRSLTYQGIANAIGDQWGPLLKDQA